MVWVEGEAGDRVKLSAHWVEDAAAEVDYSSADAALGMYVRLVRGCLSEVVRSRAVTQVHVGDEPELGQRLQGAVDRGDVQARGPHLHVS